MIPVKVFVPALRDNAFYGAVGPFFMSAAVRKEMPYLDDRADKVWFVPAGSDRPVAISAVYADKVGDIDVSYLTSLYVKPEHRHRGIGRDLVAYRIEWLRLHRPSHEIRTMCVPALVPLYEALGFKGLWTRGKYSQMARRVA